MDKESLSYVQIAGVQYVAVDEVIAALMRQGKRDVAAWLAASATGAVLGVRRVRV